jgi:DNA-binding LytR/AlgR family response regulator
MINFEFTSRYFSYFYLTEYLKTMNPITAIIVDDEQEARDILAGIITDNVPEVTVISKASSADEAIGKIISENPDLVFLDIDMPHKDGFAVAGGIASHNLSTTIIFVTAFNQYAIDAIRCAAFDYLLKPVIISDLKSCISRYIATRKTESLQQSVARLLGCLNNEKIAFNSRTGTVYLDLQEILYCEAEGNYTEIAVTRGEKHILTTNLGSIEARLSDRGFARISRSVLINKRYLHKIDRREKKCILLANGQSYTLDIKGSYTKKLM